MKKRWPNYLKRKQNVTKGTTTKRQPRILKSNQQQSTKSLKKKINPNKREQRKS